MIAALERLRALRARKHEDGPVADGAPSALWTEPLACWIAQPSQLPMEWRIEWEERAAILEFDGGLGREEADRRALREIVERMEGGQARS